MDVDFSLWSLSNKSNETHEINNLFWGWVIKSKLIQWLSNMPCNEIIEFLNHLNHSESQQEDFYQSLVQFNANESIQLHNWINKRKLDEGGGLHKTA